MRQLGVVLTCITVVAGVLWLAWLWDKNTPNSTAGVSIVGDNLARLPAGETFILTHKSGKVTEVWKITYDGVGSVRLDYDAGWFSDHRAGTLCGEGCSTDVDMGLGNHFYVSLRQDGAVDVKWPGGWNYRPYRP